MTVRTASLVVLALIAPFASAEDAAKEVADAAMPSKDLLDGMMIGRISEFESQIRDAWVVLHFLEKEHGDGIENVRKIEVITMNTALFALGHEIEASGERSDWPFLLQYQVRISSRSGGDLMKMIRQARSDHGWTDPDAKQERVIGEAFDRYAAFGNAYGIDAKTPLQPPAPRHADPEPGKP